MPPWSLSCTPRNTRFHRDFTQESQTKKNKRLVPVAWTYNNEHTVQCKNNTSSKSASPTVNNVNMKNNSQPLTHEEKEQKQNETQHTKTIIDYSCMKTRRMKNLEKRRNKWLHNLLPPTQFQTDSVKITPQTIPLPFDTHQVKQKQKQNIFFYNYKTKAKSKYKFQFSLPFTTHTLSD